MRQLTGRKKTKNLGLKMLKLKLFMAISKPVDSYFGGKEIYLRQVNHWTARIWTFVQLNAGTHNVHAGKASRPRETEHIRSYEADYGAYS